MTKFGGKIDAAANRLTYTIIDAVFYSLRVFPALIVHSELKSVHPGFPVAFIFMHKLINI